MKTTFFHGNGVKMTNTYLHGSHLKCTHRENFNLKNVQTLQKDTLLPWPYMEISNEQYLHAQAIFMLCEESLLAHLIRC